MEPTSQTILASNQKHGVIDTPFATEFDIELSGALDSDEAPHVEDVVALDPEVLASLVIQLRTNLSSAIRERNEARGERDGLIGDLAVIQTRLQELEGAHEREVEMLNEMSTWRKRCEDAEEQVGLLRQKVEESRRAVMTLQTQSRRQSQLAVGYAPSPHASSFALDPSPRTPAFGKRTSLQIGTNPGPLLGPPPKSHRRQSSSSEPGATATTSTDSNSSHGISTEDSPSLSRQTSEQESAEAKAARRASHRQSTIHIRPTESLLNPLGAEIENLKQELLVVRQELAETKHELWESNEAKEASDVCLRALKDFINENSIGAASSPDPSSATSDPLSLKGLSLPPLPTDNIPDADEEEQWTRTPVATHVSSPSTSSKKGWGLGFWSSTSTPVAESGSATTIKSPAANDVVSQSSISPTQSTKSPSAPAGGLSSFVSKWRRTEAPTTLPESTPPAVTSSPNTASPTTILSAFKWNTPAPPLVPTKDNYTPAPTPGSIRRRPSAYRSMNADTDVGSIGRRVSTASSLRSQGAMGAEGLGILGRITSEPEDMSPAEEKGLSPDIGIPAYVDTTPSLTDAETNPASGSEPASPSSVKSKPLPTTELAVDSGKEAKKSSASSINNELPRSRPTSTTPLKSALRVKEIRVSPATPSLRSSEFVKTRVPNSPKTPVPELPKTPLTEGGRKRPRSRAASIAARATSGMETIEESKSSVEKFAAIGQ